ncbi:AraC family transcriptional regulator [Parashewanella tropica]|uniref:AraC family transcriptional regulator n=1 Tax=Parashewanella tropica TaxID=2547970 RepID=UPI00105947C1|nr:helix-turn-helix transcriptional regulator [Parashewanella tropica]
MIKNNDDYSFSLMSLPETLEIKGVTYSPSQKVSWHQHPEAQLLYASSGVIRLLTENCCWIAPPLRAVWIPANARHQLEIVKTAKVKSFKITAPDFLEQLPRQSQVIAISPLVREIILYLHSSHWPENHPHSLKLISVLVEQLQVMVTEPLQYPRSDDPKIQTILNKIEQTPEDTTSLEQWAAQLHTTEKTLSRRFNKEMKMGFRQCRIQIRLLKAVELLAQNKSVIEVSYSLGFSNESNFIKSFKAAFGVTPKQYFK